MVVAARDDTHVIALKGLDADQLAFHIANGAEALSQLSPGNRDSYMTLSGAIEQKLLRNPESPRFTERERGFSVAALLSIQARELALQVADIVPNAMRDSFRDVTLKELDRYLSVCGWNSKSTSA